MEEPNVDLLVDQIKSGDLDGGIAKLIEACRLRLENGTTQIKWRIDLGPLPLDDDRVISEDDLTMKMAATVEKITGSNWGQLNPLSSGNECLAIIGAYLFHTGDDGKLSDVVNRVGDVPVSEVVKAIGSYEVDAPPKD